MKLRIFICIKNCVHCFYKIQNILTYSTWFLIHNILIISTHFIVLVCIHKFMSHPTHSYLNMNLAPTHTYMEPRVKEMSKKLKPTPRTRYHKLENVEEIFRNTYYKRERDNFVITFKWVVMFGVYGGDVKWMDQHWLMNMYFIIHTHLKL